MNCNDKKHSATSYNTHTLGNGLRIIHRLSAGDVIYCGYALKVGTRDELPGEEGLAHFCEHASFKGTHHRKGWQVIQTLEGVGGELNAYTNKESTVYYAAIQRQHLHRAIDLLTDMVFDSSFPEHEIEKEKEVICDEIESYNDSPAELIYDEFENIIFANHPLGHNILGTSDQVRQYCSNDARRFTHRHYRPDNAIFFVYGNIDFKKVVKELEKAIRSVEKTMVDDVETGTSQYESSSDQTQTCEEKGGERTGDKNNNETSYEPIVRNLNTHQAHVMLGRKAYSINDERRITLYLLNNILGGPAMSSRLNMALRERNGLVYTVESSMVSYADTGLWSIYFGCDAHDVKRCLRLVRRELDKLMQKPMSERQLRLAKQQLIGQIALACDSREGFALDFAKSFLHYGWLKDVSALCNNVMRITAQDLHEVAQDMFKNDKIRTLIYK